MCGVFKLALEVINWFGTEFAQTAGRLDMAGEKSDGEKAKKIVSLLPKENCGKCGFENCGRFALAVAEGQASPFGCQKDPSAGYEISKVLGIEASEEAKVAADYPRRGKIGISAGIVGGLGCGHAFGHHGHHGHGKGRLGHQHSGRHHSRRHVH